MKRASVSPLNKGKSKSLNKTASSGLVGYLNEHFPKTIPIAALTAASKYFAKGKNFRK
jgi:hypothetical protein